MHSYSSLSSAASHNAPPTFAHAFLSSRPYHDHPSLFLSLLETLSRTNHIATTEQLIEELEPRLPLSLRHYTTLLFGWCRLGKLDETKHVLARMKAAGVVPNIIVFDTLLVGFIAGGRFKDAFELSQEMEQWGCQPNIVSYTTLMQGGGLMR